MLWKSCSCNPNRHEFLFMSYFPSTRHFYLQSIKQEIQIVCRIGRRVGAEVTFYSIYEAKYYGSTIRKLPERVIRVTGSHKLIFSGLESPRPQSYTTTP